ncbi:hypothetical protein NP493_2g21000 [Ridgeia piscesae]|uniref:Uncharacterized protein n=1 Tax=Ridgeia piscesae TaxID=27915 RepID=A0AAD9ULZ4_RIDPI|nr:hypothetical protein NP493_2g21000 [Ridgeia piscesae]
MLSSSSVSEGIGEDDELDDTFVDYPPTPVSTGCDVNPFGSAERLVILPERYCPGKVGKAGTQGGKERSLKEREDDLGVAIQWLRQEVLAMKEHDKSLMRSFIELRSNLHRLRMRPAATRWRLSSSSSSGSSVASFSGSSASLDDRYEARFEWSTIGSSLSDNEYLGEFRPRTVSLLTPRKTNITRCIRSSESKAD